MTATDEERALRYVEGFGLRPHKDGLDVVGGKRTARLKGPERQAVTLRVVDLLRTGHSLEEAAERLRLPIETVRARVAPLIRLGALTHEDLRTDAPAQMVRFFERTLGVEAAASALGRLAGSTVYLDGGDEVARAMAGQLRRSGVGTIADLSGATDPVNAGTPVLVISRGTSSAAREPGLPTLFVALGANEALVGPLCEVPGGRCGHCLDLPRPPAQDGAADPASVQVGVALAVGEAVRFLSGTGYCRTSGGAVRIRGRGKDQSFEPVARDARCTRCGLPGVTLSDESIQAYRSFQAADVPLKPNWSYPISSLKVPRADSTIKVLPLPDTGPEAEVRLRWNGALGKVADVFALPARSRRDHIPAVGGTNLLNVFVCGAAGDRPALYCLDRRRGLIRELPANGLAGTSIISADHLTVIVSATLSRAENLFGGKANLTIYQDTGFAMAALRASLAREGFGSVRRPTPAGLPAEIMRTLGLDPGRDVVTAIVDVPVEPDLGPPPVRARGTKRPKGSSSVGRTDIEAALAAISGHQVEIFVRCHRVDGMASGLYQVTRRPAGLRGVPVASGELDTALADRGTDPDALVLFADDIGRALAGEGATGIATCVIEHAQAAQQVHRAARDIGLDAMSLVDLPSTALAPDGRGRRTAYRSFAAVALAADAPDATDDPAVLW